MALISSLYLLLLCYGHETDSVPSNGMVSYILVTEDLAGSQLTISGFNCAVKILSGMVHLPLMSLGRLAVSNELHGLAGSNKAMIPFGTLLWFQAICRHEMSSAIIIVMMRSLTV